MEFIRSCRLTAAFVFGFILLPALSIAQQSGGGGGQSGGGSGGVTSLTGDGTIINNSASTGAVTISLANTPTGTGSVVLSVSPAITGTPTAPTATAGTNTTQIATTAFVLGQSGHAVSAPLVCAAASASSTAYTCSTSPTFVPVDGDVILFQADVASGASPTIAVNGQAAGAAQKNVNGALVGVVANDFVIGGDYLAEWDGAHWQMQGNLGTALYQGSAAGTFPTLNQNTTGSAASLSVSGQTGLFTIAGLTSTNRAKTVRDAADTLLELGGSYTPTGTWTSMTFVTPALGTPASGTLTNATGLPISTGVSGLGTGVATALGTNTNSAGGFVTSPVPIANGGVTATSAVQGAVPNTTSTSAATWSATPTLGVASSANGSLTLSSSGSATQVTLGESSSAAFTMGAGLTFTAAAGAGTTINTSTSNASITIAPNGTGQVILNLGAVGNVTLEPTGGSTNTGLYFPNTSSLCWAAAGTCQAQEGATGYRVGDASVYAFSQSAAGTGTTGAQLGVSGTGTTEGIDATGGTSTGLMWDKGTCTFALTTSTFTLALSPVSICSYTLPNVAHTYYWTCTGGWSNPAGTTPTFAVGVTWAQAPSAAFQMAGIDTTNAGVTTQGSTSTTTNANIVATGVLTNSATIFQTTLSGTFTSSATSGTFSPTVSLTGTGATGTMVGGCLLRG